MRLDSPARFFTRHAVIGMIASVAATALVYFSNFAGVGDLLDRSDDGILFAVLMVLFLGPTLSAVQIAFALFLERDDAAG
ncbi:MAG: hypothetical protein NXI16_10390 [Alphaproteobacteria bacterium]|nr:hypothetical protein [Alphaproteobacteria bacterium]